MRLSLLGAGVVLFLAISFLLARFLQTENVERDAIFTLLQHEARGDAAGMLSRLDACAQRPSCRATVLADARSLRRPGDVKILNVSSHTAYTLTSATGVTRVAWAVPTRLPVVQCVLVHREGSFFTGFSVHLLSVSAPIPGTSTC